MIGLFALVAALNAPSLAAQTDDRTRTQAREHFDRGLRLFNDGDNAGALSELLAAYQLVPHPLVLYNVALVRVAMNDHVEAVAAFGRLLEHPELLGGRERRVAEARRAEQAALVDALSRDVDVSGATSEVADVAVATTPARAPVGVEGELAHALQVEREAPPEPSGSLRLHPVRPDELEPTAEEQSRYRRAALRRRRLSIALLSVGAAAAVGSVVLLAYNAEQKNDDERRLAQAELAPRGGACGPGANVPVGPSATECGQERRALLEQLERTRNRDVYGWAGFGVGLATAATGVMLLITGDDPHRYELRPERHSLRRLRAAPWFAGRGGGLTLVRSF